MRLLLKQRLFSWFDSYDIYDEAGNTVYTVEGKLAWGHCLHILNAAGDHIGTVREQVLTFLPKFELYVQDQYVGCIQKEFTFFTPKFDIDCNGWRVEGDFLEWDYRVTEACGAPVASIHKELLHWTDTYVIDVADPGSALCVLMLVCFAGCTSGQGATTTTAAPETTTQAETTTAAETTAAAADATTAAEAGDGVWANATYTEDTELGEGAVTVKVEVKAEDKSVTFTLHTDKTILGDALLEHSLVAGDESEYGLYVKVVNGMTADFDVDQAYWAFYKDGEMMNTGVDGATIADGEHYELVYTK